MPLSELMDVKSLAIKNRIHTASIFVGGISLKSAQATSDVVENIADNTISPH